MNMQAVMAQAKKLQAELERTTKEIENKTFTYENENVLIEAKGTNKISKVVIKNNDILEDAEMLSDIIVIGINNVIDQIKKEKDSKIGKYTNGLGGLF